METLQRKDGEMQAMEERYKKYIEKVRSCSSFPSLFPFVSKELESNGIQMIKYKNGPPVFCFQFSFRCALLA